MNKKRIISLSIVSVLLIVALVFGTLSLISNLKSYGVRPEIDGRAENVILFIGDGMGFNHLEISSYYEELYMTSLPYSGSVATRSLSVFPTDSGAGATALATGYKVKNRRISYSNGKPLMNLGDYTAISEKKLGVVTTKSVTDATPAAFTSHNKSRRNQQEIALQQINYTHIDVLFGLGREYYDNYSDIVLTTDRAYVNTYEDLLSTTKEQAYAIFDNPIPTEGEFTLASLTSIALNMLKNENGFFLMVEGAKIDTYSHDNDLEGMLKELRDFDNAVKVALDFVTTNPNTTIIVTADHETGGLTLPKEWSDDAINDKLFTKGGHTSKDVPYFALGPGANQIPIKIDNTDIFFIIRQILFNY